MNHSEMKVAVDEVIEAKERVVKHLRGQYTQGKIGLYEIEAKIHEFTLWVGDVMVKELIEQLPEPTQANRIVVEEQVAVFEGVRNLRFINRFGEEVVRPRRCYRFVNQPGGFVPLDAELGMDHCWGFSPQMSYLMSLFGADEPFGSAAGKLSTAVGFPVSPSAVQRTTEQIGERIPEEPGQLIEAKKQQESCEVMVIEADGTLSGQIHEEEGLRGHESLKQPLEYKEANLVVIEKYEDGERRERWTGARYGPRSEFETYAGKAGVAMGFLKACKAVFLGDGAHQNWELQQTHFPGATPILDFYHALEHLGTFTTLLTEEPRAYQDAQSWPQRLKDGEVLEVIAEMKGLLPQLSDTAEGWRQINYFQRNQHRMHYDLYRQLGYPIGSGLVEGQCKFVIAKRFKGSGMRWKRHDNECTLRTRLAYLNDQLPRYFAPLPQQWRPAA